ncbi:hypothetical protein AVEN_51183-1 [Araneus ventricosus]|uniref:Uncharacterized protein n=1 Tax=Araneus ventricosus TaxID=182803 RepID=A0A4Y2RRL5_ARAVE|nr:hypothetical protein AVEN_51183-1 [Araneus ventricosus]
MAVQNSNLPPSFVNEVVKIVEDEIIVRRNLKSVSDVYLWIEEYGRTSDTKWNLRSSRPSGTRLVCCSIRVGFVNMQPGPGPPKEKNQFIEYSSRLPRPDAARIQFRKSSPH